MQYVELERKRKKTKPNQNIEVRAFQRCSEYCHISRRNLTRAGDFRLHQARLHTEEPLQVLMQTPTHNTASVPFSAQTGSTGTPPGDAPCPNAGQELSLP